MVRFAPRAGFGASLLCLFISTVASSQSGPFASYCPSFISEEHLVACHIELKDSRAWFYHDGSSQLASQSSTYSSVLR